jgi:NAD(P)-dependent dehydrogenase (short-subunit alcohol dehydrogenase family)/rhamnose utilization protein RhaD (predicted bifunctional aldolase and dehydrogenase)
VPRELAELIEISRAIGGDADLVQGGGGNTSVKSRSGRRIFVKASGTALGAMDERRGWAELDLRSVRGLARQEKLGTLEPADREHEVLRLLQGAVVRPRGARPSVEASLHGLLDRVVIHVHPVHLNAFLCSRDSRERYGQLFRSLEDPPLYVPYVDPGFTLAARLSVEIEDYRDSHGKLPSVVLLENHGVFVAASETEDSLRLLEQVVEIGRKWTGQKRVNPPEFPLTVDVPRKDTDGPEDVSAAGLRGALLQGGCAPLLLRKDPTSLAKKFTSRPDWITVARQGAFSPDQIVYCRTHPLILDRLSAADWVARVRTYREKHGVDPRVILLRPLQGNGDSGGVYYAGTDLDQIRVVSEVYRGALTAILKNDRGGGPRFLNREQAGFIESWEVEHYRAALLQEGGRPLAGRVAVVTGAASGLGKGIAVGMVEAGAAVFACDINIDGLEAVRAELSGNRYLPLAIDVTSEESVKDAFRQIESSAGGLDFLVNAAGVAPPYKLVDFPVAAWKKALDINLTGYFLCAREAARLLTRQGVGGSIVNLTSKSGLEASRDNSAYNATKAGEIHLMRGWALELGEAGIRVNCVAPGNVFKGSQIWNPEYIRVCARKKGIKPEEVIPYYNSLTALKQEIEPQDIARAVLFLVSDESRRITGQTLVVDGGQVMVR